MNDVHTQPNYGEQGMVDVPYATQPHLPPDDAISAMISNPLSLDLDRKHNVNDKSATSSSTSSPVQDEETRPRKSRKTKKTKKGKRRRIKGRDSVAESSSKYVSIKEGVDVEASVKGGAGMLTVDALSIFAVDALSIFAVDRLSDFREWISNGFG